METPNETLATTKITAKVLTQIQAEAVAARVPPNVGFDPVIIITILTQVLPLLVLCFQQGDQSHNCRNVWKEPRRIAMSDRESDSRRD